MFFFSFCETTNHLFVSCFWNIIIVAGARKVRSMTEGWGEHKSDVASCNTVALDCHVE